MTKADQERADREWRRLLGEHAAHVMHGVITHGAELIANSRAAALLGGPTIEIEGPDGEWRRYYVRLTEVPRCPCNDPDCPGQRKAK